QLARHGAVRRRLRDDRHHRRARVPDRCRVRAAAHACDRLGGAGSRRRGGPGMMRRAAVTDAFIGALPIAILLAVWYAIAASGLAPPALLPAPQAVFARFAEQLANPSFLRHAAVTLLRLFTG